MLEAEHGDRERRVGRHPAPVGRPTQEVCPWKLKFARDATEPEFAPREELVAPDLPSLSAMNNAEFKARFADTPLARAKLLGLKCDACLDH